MKFSCYLKYKLKVTNLVVRAHTHTFHHEYFEKKTAGFLPLHKI